MTCARAEQTAVAQTAAHLMWFLCWADDGVPPIDAVDRFEFFDLCAAAALDIEVAFALIEQPAKFDHMKTCEAVAAYLVDHREVPSPVVPELAS